jgi:hypothetical protein
VQIHLLAIRGAPREGFFLDGVAVQGDGSFAVPAGFPPGDHVEQRGFTSPGRALLR